MDSLPRLGFGGVPIGEATEDQRRPKQDIPCSAFMNTSNKETHLNTDRFLNTEMAQNLGNEINFKSSDDILEILRTHPDFSRAVPEGHHAIVAGIISALALAGGITLTVLTGGVGALIATPTISAVIKLAGGAALASAGAAGLQNAIQGGLRGTFKWSKWGQDVAVAAATSLIVLPAAIGAGHLAGYAAGLRIITLEGHGVVGEAIAFIERSIMTATSLVYSAGQGSSAIVKQLVMDGRLDPLSLVVSLAVGAYSGYVLGGLLSEAKLLDYIKDQVSHLFRDTDSRQFLTEDLVRRLVNRTGHGSSALRTPHALAEHGPGADLAARYPGFRGPTNSGFSLPGEMTTTIQNAITADPTGSRLFDNGLQTREIFNLDFRGTGESILINYASREGGGGSMEDFSGVIRVILDRRDGQLPDLITSYPVL